MALSEKNPPLDRAGSQIFQSPFLLNTCTIFQNQSNSKGVNQGLVYFRTIFTVLKVALVNQCVAREKGHNSMHSLLKLLIFKAYFQSCCTFSVKQIIFQNQRKGQGIQAQVISSHFDRVKVAIFCQCLARERAIVACSPCVAASEKLWCILLQHILEGVCQLRILRPIQERRLD